MRDDSHGHWIGQEAHGSVDLSLALGLQEKLVLLLQTILSHSHGTQVLGQLGQACTGLVGSKPKLDKEEEMSLISRPIVSRLFSGVHGFLSLMNHLEGRKLASGVVSSVPPVTRGKIPGFPDVVSSVPPSQERGC